MTITVIRTDPDETDTSWSNDPEPGRQVAIHYHRRYRSFLATYRPLSLPARIELASAYADYMSRRLSRPIDAYHVLAVWDAAVTGDIHLPARAR